MPPVESPEIGRDALDVEVARVPEAPRWAALFPRRGAALGLTASAAPALPFVLVGIALGPSVTGVMSAATLRRMEPVVAVALAMLGIFIGLGLGTLRGASAKGLLRAATIEATVTIAVVSGVMYLLLQRWAFALPTTVEYTAAVLGICACASAAMRPASAADAATHRAARVADLDDAPLILLGTIVIAQASGDPAALGHALLTLLSGVTIGAAGWLLFERTDQRAERSVYVVGSVLLLGGIGSYLGSSPLLSGCAAALVWVRAPGAADQIIAADLRKLQHPLVALLLIVAGAWIAWTPVLLWIAAPLVLLRLIGKVLGSAAAARAVDVPPALLATVLIPPGVIGIALALNVHHALGEGDATLLSGVTVALIASELLSPMLSYGLEEHA